MSAVTSDDAPTDEPSFADAAKYVFAPQVQDVLFEYFEGRERQSSWDGTQLGGADGNTPLGPPAAIAITITLRTSSIADLGEESTVRTRKYKHVVALPASNVYTQSGSGLQMSGQNVSGALQSGQMVQPTNLTNAPDSQQPSQSSGSGSGQ